MLAAAENYYPRQKTKKETQKLSKHRGARWLNLAPWDSREHLACLHGYKDQVGLPRWLLQWDQTLEQQISLFRWWLWSIINNQKLQSHGYRAHKLWNNFPQSDLWRVKRQVCHTSIPVIGPVNSPRHSIPKQPAQRFWQCYTFWL